MRGTMELFRSEEMTLLQLMIPAEAAHDTVAALGDVGLLQFKDLNPEKSAFQKTYSNQVKRCDEMARKLRFFTDQVNKSEATKGGLHTEKTYHLDELEATLDDLEKELLQINANNDRLQRSHGELLELQLVLEKAGSFFEEASSRTGAARFSSAAVTRESEMGAPLLFESAAAPPTVRLGFVAGTIPTEKLAPFERLLFRATRGNMFLRYSAVGKVSDPSTGENVEKAVFVVFFAGERARTKILKICEAYGANRYPFPEDPNRQRQMNSEVSSRLRELYTTIDAGDRHRQSALQNIANNLPTWTRLVKREKAVYHTLNRLSIDTSRKVLVAEAWCPLAAKPRVTAAIRQAHAPGRGSAGVIVQSMVTSGPEPTYFQTSKVTSGFQNICDAYGIARYREANPAVFTIVTFPFLFAVMFGDVGHAVLMLLFALYLVLNEKQLGASKLNDVMEIPFGGRYCILLMSIFSLYTGFIYNECFSIPMKLFGQSRFGCETNPAVHDRIQIHFAHGLCESAGSDGLAPLPGGPYPFGIDPAWHSTRTELQFLNSVKMKMSVVLGVIQLNFGIVMSLFNQRYFRDSLSTRFEFIPQMIFLNSLFGYLCILILAKWASGSRADLYHVMIYMFLSPGNVDCAGEAPDGGPGCKENKMYPGQGGIQVVLVLLAICMIPIMLLPKPLILRARHNARHGHSAIRTSANYGRLSDDDEETGGHANGDHDEDHHMPAAAPAAAHGGGGGGHGGHSDGGFDFGEVMVHQMIHTIEFVLGAVSNTASYLRLWALSLAHSQLSAVFYDRVMLGAIATNNVFFMVIGFYVWCMATLGVLMGMESLSAFLHALRLHWVEYMNKFYHGDGYQFTPFAFAEVDKEDL